MSDLILLGSVAFAWAYSLRAAWTGGVIYGWLSAKDENPDWFGLIQCMILWPVTLIVGQRAQRRNREGD